MEFAQTKFTARYQETDKMGIIHHSVYPVWFEAARTELIKACGYSYSSLEKMGILLPLISLEVDYILPSFYEDEMIVRSSFKVLTKTRLAVFYEVFRDPKLDTIICSGVTSHVFTDENLKPVNIYKKSPEVYEALKNIYE